MKKNLELLYLKLEKIFLILAVAGLILTVIVPLIMAGLWSLVAIDTPWSYPDILPQKLAFDRWIQVWNFTAIKDALINSYRLAPLVASLSVILALPTAYVMGRFNFQGKNYVEIITLLPMMIPGIVIALFFTQVLNTMGVSNKFWGIALGHTLITLPYSVRILSASFHKIPQDQIDAARDLGANKFTVFVTAYLPLVRPALFASFIYIFLRSIEEFNISYILGSPDFVTVPTILFSFLGYNFVRPNAAVVSLILVVPNIFLMFFIEKFLNADKDVGSGVKG